MMCMEHSYVLAVEQLLNLAVPERGQYIRVLYSEVRGEGLVTGLSGWVQQYDGVLCNEVRVQGGEEGFARGS